MVIFPAAKLLLFFDMRKKTCLKNENRISLIFKGYAIFGL